MSDSVDKRCENGKLAVLFWYDSIPSCHASCIHNEIEALEKRHLIDQPVITSEGLLRLNRGYSVLRRMMRKQFPNQVEKWTYDEVIATYSGAKRRTYQRAKEELLTIGRLQRDAMVTAFVKASKYVGDMIPRIIQARTPKYNLLVAQYHKPMEHRLYKLLGSKRVTGVKVSKWCAKNDNAYQRAATIRKKMKQFECPLVVQLDASKFDGHVQEVHQKHNHTLYYEQTKSREHIRLLARTLSTRGVTASGHKYVLGARRASGDMDTACGNTAIMLGCTVAYAAENYTKFDIYDDGDDCLLFVESREWTVESEVKLKEQYLTMGFRMSCRVSREYHDVVFCRSRPVRLSSGWKMVRDPLLVLNTALVSHKYFLSNDQMVKQYAAGYEAMTAGEPITGPFFRALADRVGRDDAYTDLELEYKVRMSGTGVHSISHENRASYAEAYDLTVEEQQNLETLLLSRLVGWDLSTPITKVEC